MMCQDSSCRVVFGRRRTAPPAPAFRPAAGISFIYCSQSRFQPAQARFSQMPGAVQAGAPIQASTGRRSRRIGRPGPMQSSRRRMNSGQAARALTPCLAADRTGRRASSFRRRGRLKRRDTPGAVARGDGVGTILNGTSPFREQLAPLGCTVATPAPGTVAGRLRLRSGPGPATCRASPDDDRADRSPPGLAATAVSR